METWHGEFDEAPVAVTIFLVPTTGLANFHFSRRSQTWVQSTVPSRFTVDIKVVEIRISYFEILSLSLNVFGGPVEIRMSLL